MSLCVNYGVFEDKVVTYCVMTCLQNLYFSGGLRSGMHMCSYLGAWLHVVGVGITTRTCIRGA